MIEITKIYLYGVIVSLLILLAIKKIASGKDLDDYPQAIDLRNNPILNTPFMMITVAFFTSWILLVITLFILIRTLINIWIKN